VELKENLLVSWLRFTILLDYRVHLLVKELWKDQSGWDNVLPLSIQTKWSKRLQGMKKMEQVEVLQRYFSSLPHRMEKEIHAFCDASQNTYYFFYAGAVYIRTVTPSGTAHVSLNQKGFFLFRSCCE